jgi:hypothetical protein
MKIFNKQFIFIFVILNIISTYWEAGNVKTKKVFPIILLVFLMFLGSFIPVRASTYESWQDTTPIEYEGIWNTGSNYAKETLYSTVYRIVLVFECYYVDQDADDYWIELDYNGVTPWLWPAGEDLEMLYRWGTSGGFTHLANLGFWAVDTDFDITAPTSSILQIKFRGTSESSDTAQNTWYFGDEPILWAYWD